MDEATLKRLIANVEDEHAERKSGTNQFDKNKLFSYIAALANEGGGYLFLGVADDGTIIGTSSFKNIPQLKEDILTNGSMSRRLRVDIYETIVNGLRVLTFKIPSHPQGEAVAHKGAYYMRSGGMSLEQ